jgi:L-lactate dehydrogenase (cytochrome)
VSLGSIILDAKALVAIFMSVKSENTAPKRRNLAKAKTISDLKVIAKQLTPSALFDYVDGAADDEVCLSRVRKAYQDIEFKPHVLRDVSKTSLQTEMCGDNYSLPLGLAPVGFQRMIQFEGESASAYVAGMKGIPFALSTMGTISIEQVAQEAPDGSNWFQIYLLRDRDQNLALINRAARAGFTGLIITVDAQTAGTRLRDLRNNLKFPLSLTSNMFLEVPPKIRWWYNFVTKGRPSLGLFSHSNSLTSEMIGSMVDQTITIKDLVWLRSVWSGNILVKGVQRVDDALAIAKCDVDGIWISNHGGRQLDRATIPLRLIAPIRKKLGKSMEIHIDTGIMHGADVIASIALGANFAWVGRAYMYGLMAGGSMGVAKAIEILETQMMQTMRLLGVNVLSELNPSFVETNF